MKKTATLLLFVLMTSFLFVSCNLFSSKKKEKADEIKLGMLFEKKEVLAGIPMASTPFGGTELPASVDLSASMPPVGNQGDQQSCVAWAVAYALKSYQEKLELHQQLLFSPSFIYNQINNGMNVPTYVTDALNLLSQEGVCTWDEMPYKDSDWVSKPSTVATEDAKRFRIDYWRQVNIQDPKEVKAQLASGYPVIIGAQVSREFVNDGYLLKSNYIWKDKGVPVGGHAMLLIGYDDAKRAFKIMNSWGTEWGDNGFGWISYDIFRSVVSYGFVAKDATTPAHTENTNTLTENYPDLNKANPTTFDTIYFHKTNVEHNVIIPDDSARGNAMKIEGRLDLPPGYGKKMQIVVHVYDSKTNQQVKTLIYPDYSDINHFAAGYTPEYDIPAEGLRNQKWWLHIPYGAIDLPLGTSYLYAIPTLFIDNFGVAHGERIDFSVTLK